MNQRIEIKAGRQKIAFKSEEDWRSRRSASIVIRELEGAEEKVVDASMTSALPVVRYGFIDGKYQKFYEKLSMKKKHIRAERLDSGSVPVLDSHWSWDLSDQIGSVADYRIEGEEIFGSLIRRTNEKSVEIFRDIDGGVIRNGSIGYVVHEYKDVSGKDDEFKTLEAVDWELLEFSIVPIPADYSSGPKGGRNEIQEEINIDLKSGELEARDINTEKEIELMDTEVQEPKKSAKSESQLTEADLKKASAVGQKSERERIQAIKKISEKHNLPKTVEEKAIDDEISVEAFREVALEELAKQSEKKEIRNAGVDATITRDERENTVDGITNYVEHRLGVGNLDENGRRFGGSSILEIGKALGARGGSPYEVARRTVASSDLEAIFSNVANKQLQGLLATEDETYKDFTEEAPFTNLKEKSIFDVSEWGKLEKVAEGSAYQSASFTSNKETYKLAKYGKEFHYTEEMALNDDISVLLEFPKMVANSVKDLKTDLAYSPLLNNPTMGDGKALFHSDHGNLLAGAAPSDAALSVAVAAMRKQKNSGGNRALGLKPQNIICGPDLEYTFLKLLAQVNATTVDDVNVHAGKYGLLVEPTIEGNKWFMHANKNRVGLVELGFLEGMKEPVLSSRVDEAKDRITWKVKYFGASKAKNFRGFVYNPGS